MKALRRPRPGRWLAGFAALGVLGVWLALPAAAPAQDSGTNMTGIELNSSTQLALRRLGESSIDWHRAFLAGDAARGQEVLGELLQAARALEMQRLPDHSLAALVRAVQAAEEGNFEQAEQALDAAERLDPERPETAFARATIHRLEGSYPAAILDTLEGYSRLFRLPHERSLWFYNLLLWVLYTLVASGGLYVVLLVTFRGGPLIADLARFGQRFLPGPLALGVVVLLIGGLLLLPFGLLWLLLLASVLLWVHGSWSERLTLTLVWLLLGVAPILVDLHRQRMEVALSPPMRAVNSLAEGRLYGSLFSDLGVLRTVLPESGAIRHLMADLNRRLGQWQIARSMYRDLLEAEPDNASALIDLGVFFFDQEDYGGAARYFLQATVADPRSAVAYYNLAQAYTSNYLYEDSSQALSRAQELDQPNVSRWIRESEKQQVVVVDGGFERIPEIRAQLWELRLQADQAPSWKVDLLRRGLSLIAVLVLLLTAIGLRVASRGGRPPEPPMDLDSTDSPGDLLLRVLIPGLRSVRGGNGPLAYLALWVPVGLLLLPLGRFWGYRMPWGYDPGAQMGLVVTTVGLVFFLLLRLLQQRRLED